MKNIFKIKKINVYNKSAGFTIVEVLVACIIITTMTLVLMSSSSKGIELSYRSIKQAQASMLLEEGVEAVKSIRDASWTTISGLGSGIYYLSFNTSTNKWTLSTNQESKIDEMFDRTITFSDVYRDTNDNIASTGELDSGIKYANINVTWANKSGEISKNIEFYIANIFN